MTLIKQISSQTHKSLDSLSCWKNITCKYSPHWSDAHLHWSAEAGPLARSLLLSSWLQLSSMALSKMCGIRQLFHAYVDIWFRLDWILWPNGSRTFCKCDGKLKTDGLTPGLSRTVCPVLSKSSGLKCSLQSNDLSVATKPFRFTASSHCLFKFLSLGNLKNVIK